MTDEQKESLLLIYGGVRGTVAARFIPGSSTSHTWAWANQAPVSWASPSTAISLLAACVVGAASKATAAVTEGELHPGREARP